MGDIMKKEIAATLIALVLGTLIVPNTDTKFSSTTYDEYLCMTNHYHHSTDSFTQGLFFHNEKMYETTGLYGQSSIYKNVDIKSGESEKSYSFDKSIFAEGSVVFNNELYVLTYKENKVLVFDPDTLHLKRELPYNRQGWGLTTDGKYLIASDGSSEIFFMDKQLNTIKQITITREGAPVKNINELEYIEGKIWANEWLTNNILIINPENGNVIKQLDFTEICNNHNTGTNDVLNGIAYNEKAKKIYITGKRWDSLYELEVK